MRYYSVPTTEQNPNQIVLHFGTNNLPTDKTPVQISNNIIGLATGLKTSTNTVVISGIIPRRDEHNKNGKELNELLKKLCNNNNIPFISHANINPYQCTNRKGLHLNNHVNKKLLTILLDF